jgi:hypothetical protein
VPPSFARLIHLETVVLQECYELEALPVELCDTRLTLLDLRRCRPTPSETRLLVPEQLHRKPGLKILC